MYIKYLYFKRNKCIVLQPVHEPRPLYFRCAICLAEYQEKEMLRIMPKCGHSFHLSCIDIWLRKQSTCPVCRLSVHDSIQTKYVRPPVVSGRTPSFDNSDVSAEHSQIWLISSGERSEETTTTTTTSNVVQTHPDSVTINVETSVSREAAVES